MSYLNVSNHKKNYRISRAMDKQTGIKSEQVSVKVGSRNSQLALIQTNLVIEQLKKFYDNNPDHLEGLSNNNRIDFDVTSMTTTGDQILDKALPDIGTKSLFTKELEVALLAREVDFVVHSLKDLPTTLPRGCVIGAITKRDDPEDSIVLKASLRNKTKPLDILFNQHDQKIRIGTSSQRRIAMLRRCNQAIECDNIRGNLNTRLAKLDRDDGKYSAIILAKAGLNRMGWADRASDSLTPVNDHRLKHWCYAVGQGALAVECRVDDDFILNLLEPLVDIQTTYEAVAERSLMKKLEGGCSVPLGVRTSWPGHGSNEIKLHGIVLSLGGDQVVEATGSVALGSSDDLGVKQRSELMESTTGIMLSRRLYNKSAANLDKCSKLGIRVANCMIELGCLELLGRNRLQDNTDT